MSTLNATDREALVQLAHDLRVTHLELACSTVAASFDDACRARRLGALETLRRIAEELETLAWGDA